MTLLGAPIMVLLFVLFPRMAPLWGTPGDAMSGRSGLSGRMEVGQITSLALDDSIALRVRFESEPPGAAVLEDNKELCSPTPCDVTFKGEGGAGAREHKIVLNKKGFKSTTIVVSPSDSKMSSKLDVWASGGGAAVSPGPAQPPTTAPKFDGCLDNSDCKGGKTCVHGWCK